MTNNCSLPEGWRRGLDPKFGREYYYNTLTRRSTWTKPDFEKYLDTKQEEQEQEEQEAQGYQSDEYYTLKNGGDFRLSVQNNNEEKENKALNANSKSTI